jgi:hypothetical protein
MNNSSTNEQLLDERTHSGDNSLMSRHSDRDNDVSTVVMLRTTVVATVTLSRVNERLRKKCLDKKIL